MTKGLSVGYETRHRSLGYCRSLFGESQGKRPQVVVLRLNRITRVATSGLFHFQINISEICQIGHQVNRPTLRLEPQLPKAGPQMQDKKNQKHIPPHHAWAYLHADA